MVPRIRDLSEESTLFQARWSITMWLKDTCNLLTLFPQKKLRHILAVPLLISFARAFLKNGLQQIRNSHEFASSLYPSALLRSISRLQRPLSRSIGLLRHAPPLGSR